MKEGGRRDSVRMMHCEKRLPRLLLAMKMVRGHTKEGGQPPESEKARKSIRLMSLQKRTQPCQDLEFGLGRPISDF